MNKRRHAEQLISYLRWAIILPCIATANSIPKLQIAIMLLIVCVYNGILTYCIVDQDRFTAYGRRLALLCRIFDGCLITYASVQIHSNNSPMYLLYWFILVSLGYAAFQMRSLVIATITILLINAGATFYSLSSILNSANLTREIIIRSSLIIIGSLISIFIAKTRSREDQALNRGSHLHAILDCGSKLASYSSVHELAYYVLETAVKEINAAGGELLLINDESNGLELEAFYQIDGQLSSSAPSDDRLKAYAKWVINSGREFMVVPGAINVTNEIDSNHDERAAIATPLLGQISNSSGEQTVLGVLIVWAYVGENLIDDAMDMLRIFSAIAGAALVNLKLYTNLKESFLNTLQSLARGLEARDEYTRGHSERVTQVALALAEELDVPAERIELLRNAALLHDIGKIGVPDAVLSKPGKLTQEEWETMRRHSIVSGEICRPLGLPEDVLFLITHHHERLDGKGYPSGLTAQELPFLQRILTVSDTFDAMRSRRPYRDSMPEEDLVAEFNRCAGRTLDPTVVDALKRLLFRRDLDSIYEEHDLMTSMTTISILENERKAA